MKNKFVLLPLLSLLFLLPIESCKKYDDGPWISFRSKTQRITGSWELESLTADGNDSTQAAKSQSCYGSIDIYKSGGWSIEYNGGCFTKGHYVFDKNKTHVYFSLLSTTTNPSFIAVGPFITIKEIAWEIKRLTNDELWIETDFENIHWVAHLYNEKP